MNWFVTQVPREVISECMGGRISQIAVFLKGFENDRFEIAFEVMRERAWASRSLSLDDRQGVHDAGQHQATRALIDRDAGKAATIVEALPSNTRRTDALEAAQVPGW